MLLLSLLLLGVNGESVTDSNEDLGSPRLIIPMPTHDVQAVRGVLRRMPEWVDELFPVIEIGDGGQLMSGSGEIEEMEDGRLRARGTSPTDVLFIIHAYLRQYCNSLVTWSGSSFGQCKKGLVGGFGATAPRVRYFGNYETFSYSFPWWTWQEWEPFIDWLALNGINMMLAPIGQEYVYRMVWMEMGIPEEEIDGFFTGDAFLAWHRMGNLKHLGGGVFVDHLKKQLELNKKIVARLVSLGIVPVLPTFAGFVPDAFRRLYPDVEFVRNECWNGFNETHSCVSSVAPSEPLFEEIAKKFIEKQKEIYGDVTSVYSADPFNGNVPQSVAPDATETIFRGCRQGNENCIWMLQSRAFKRSNGDSWSSETINTVLSAVPVGSLLVLDVHAEKEPMYMRTEAFHGHYFIWCMLHNFGGNRQLRGNFGDLSTGYNSARRSNLKMVGGGLTMEAINQNYVIYQYFIDQMWAKNELNTEEWLHYYARARYGGARSSLADKVWSVLADTMYNEPSGQVRFNLFIYERPSLTASYEYWYDMYKIIGLHKALHQLNKTLGHNELFRQDYLDLLRTTKEYEIATGGVDRVREGYGLNDSRILKSGCEKLDRMFEELDLLAYDEKLNLLSWLSAARSSSTTEKEGALLEKQALYQITLWNGDHARKEWSGLIRKYYAKRWRFLCDYLASGIRFNQKKFDQRILHEIEQPFGEL